MNATQFRARLRPGPTVRPELGPCLDWTGAIDAGGYGVLRWNGKTRRAHQVAYELQHGHPPPIGMVIEHACDRRSCSRDSHLTLGTHASNAADRSAKGRSAKQRHRRHPVRALW